MADATINHPARRAYAEVLRQFFSGRLTNDQAAIWTDKNIERLGTDSGVDLIHDVMESEVYWDARIHRFADRSMPLSRGARRVLARWVTFLYSSKHPTQSDAIIESVRSDQRPIAERSWTQTIGVGVGLFSIGPLPGMMAMHYGGSPWWLVLGAAAIFVPLAVMVFAASADQSAAGHGMIGAWEKSESDNGFWPFASMGDLKDAMTDPVLLAGSESR